jgi:hypothetical protein
VDGKDVIADASGGGFQTLAQVLGLVPTPGDGTIPSGQAGATPTFGAAQAIGFGVSLLALILVRLLFTVLWRWKFTGEHMTDFGSGSMTLFIIEGIVMISIAAAATTGSTLLL